MEITLVLVESLVNQFEPGWERMQVLVSLAALQSQQQQPERALRSLETALSEMRTADVDFQEAVDTITYSIISPFSYGGGQHYVIVPNPRAIV